MSLVVRIGNTIQLLRINDDSVTASMIMGEECGRIVWFVYGVSKREITIITVNSNRDVHIASVMEDSVSIHKINNEFIHSDLIPSCASIWYLRSSNEKKISVCYYDNILLIELSDGKDTMVLRNVRADRFFHPLSLYDDIYPESFSYVHYASHTIEGVIFLEIDDKLQESSYNGTIRVIDENIGGSITDIDYEGAYLSKEGILKIHDRRIDDNIIKFTTYDDDCYYYLQSNGVLRLSERGSDHQLEFHNVRNFAAYQDVLIIQYLDNTTTVRRRDNEYLLDLGPELKFPSTTTYDYELNRQQPIMLKSALK